MAAQLPDGSEGDEVEDTGGIFAEINITPLTDVFLVMVIIFMVSALAVQAEAAKRVAKVEEKVEAEKRSGLKVNLPSGGAMSGKYRSAKSWNRPVRRPCTAPPLPGLLKDT